MAPEERGVAGETLSVFAAERTGTPLTTTEVAERLDLTRRAAYDRLGALVERNSLETKKVGARGRVWWRPAAPAGTDDPEPRDRTAGTMLDRLVGNVPGMVYRCANVPGARMTFVSDGARMVCGYGPDRFESGEVSWGADVIHPGGQAPGSEGYLLRG